MGVLKGLEPQLVFDYFEEISAVPRGSGNMEPIGNYCEEFAKKHNLEYYRDELHNVIIVKEATKGYEDSPAIIVQGHLDIVCEKTPESKIDFMVDGLDLAVDGDTLYAKGTTLGGDNGIAVAMALAILASDNLEHPRIEAVFTVDEETGLYGAEAIDVSMLKAKKFLNLDSEDEGIITVSCAGGVTAECTLPIKRESKEGIKLNIIITDLQGGHSGIEINRGRANSNKLMGRFLYSLGKEVSFNLIDAFGGVKDNVIAKHTNVEIITDEANLPAIEEAVKVYQHDIGNEYKTSDPEITIKFENLGKEKLSALDEESSNKVIYMLLTLPNGVQSMSADIEGLVETSLNWGAFKIEENSALFIAAIRSSIETAKAAVCDRVLAITKNLGGTVEFTGPYPGWEYKKDSQLRDTVMRVYEKQYGKAPIIEAIHAGLECGMFSEKIEDLDCVSIGPSMTGVHTVDEKLSISSVERTWKLIVEVLKESK